MDDELAAELLRIATEDQRIRAPPEFGRVLSVEESMRYARVDVSNTDRLREIVAQRGWPGRSLVGEQAAEAAWLLAQHADRQLWRISQIVSGWAKGARRSTGRRSALSVMARPSHGRSTTSNMSTTAARHQFDGEALLLSGAAERAIRACAVHTCAQISRRIGGSE